MKYKIEHIIVDTDHNIYIDNVINGKNLYIMKNNAKFTVLFISNSEKIISINTNIINGNIMNLEVDTQ